MKIRYFTTLDPSNGLKAENKRPEDERTRLLQRDKSFVKIQNLKILMVLIRTVNYLIFDQPDKKIRQLLNQTRETDGSEGKYPT
ncbi:hypothetical protein FisN_25Hu200 [Fistulifera solaris]|uniref:Uncharacterized protein n=1 Tax=Fistulifera solaris TaxID=1519565 RepID=A0A1Z5K704_FISSO|nr:hypothetical protein FisN_25Hu200 [Fistulifera solaris]|eukprot:GAX21999.1 hypothetical protein FisN_25Hu200 [Fistulifera solaris]